MEKQDFMLQLAVIIERYGSHKTGLNEIEQLFLAAGWQPPEGWPGKEA